jgi:hypothetical protein
MNERQGTVVGGTMSFGVATKKRRLGGWLGYVNGRPLAFLEKRHA